MTLQRQSSLIVDGTVLTELNDHIADPCAHEYYFNPECYGAVGDGVTDDTVALQAAIDAAEAVGGIVDGGNKFYAISSKLSIGGGLAIGFQNFNLKAIAGTWPTGANGSMLYITQPSDYDNGAFAFQNVSCNANDQAKTGWYVYRVAAKASFIDCHAYFFSEYGFWIKATGDGNSDTRYIACTAAERIWTADTNDAYHIYANRVAYAWYVDYSADIAFVDCIGYGSLRSLVIDNGPYNNQFIGCKFYNGPARTEATSVTVEVINGERNQFIGCRFDDGAVLLKTFVQQFIGCLFIQYDAAAMIQLEATTANEDAAGLVVSNCNFGGITTPVSLTTSGSGSWATTKLWSIVGNIKANGTTVTFDSLEFQHGAVKYTNGQYTFGDGSSDELLGLSGGPAANRLYQVKTGTEARWAWGAANTGETGSNAGSDFALYRYDDDGAYLGTAMVAYRDTGNIQINKLIMYPSGTAPALTVNGQVTFELTNNTTLTLKARGSDGTTRSVALTLA